MSLSRVDAPSSLSWLTTDYFQNELKAQLIRLGIGPSVLNDNRLFMLYRYVSELVSWNRGMNLVGTIGDDFIPRHLLDSLAPLPYFLSLKEEGSIVSAADVGSGGGLPGIPLAIFLEEIQWRLIERSTKKCGFLRNCCAVLGFGNRVKVVNQTVEEVKESFDWVVFRAFRQFEDFYPQLNRILTKHGSLIAYKGKKEVVLQELKQIKRKKENAQLHSLSIPKLNEERTLLVLPKD